MSTTERIDIQIREDGSRVVTRNLQEMGTAAAGADRQFRTMSEGIKSFVQGLVGTAILGTLARDILNTNRQMESLRTQLTGVVGSIEGGKAAFGFIQKFATDTPFEVEEVTKAFISLKNFGIEPTQKVMEAMTNQAAALGGSQETLDSITRQLGQAYAKQKLQMEDIVVLSERGVPVFKLLAEVTGLQGAALQEVISKGGITRDVIDKLIAKMGELASGSNARAMETLNGKISNLSNAWHNFEDTLLNDKSEGIIKSIVESASGLLNLLSRNISTTLDNQIAHAQARIKTFDGLGSVGKAVADFSGYDINVEKNKLDSLKRQQSAQYTANALAQGAASIAKVNAQIELEATNKVTAAHTAKGRAAVTSHASHVKAIDPVLSQYKSLLSSMEREAALAGDNSRLTAVLYDTRSGSLRNLNEGLKQNLIEHAKEIDLIKQKEEAYKEMEDVMAEGNRLAKQQQDDEASQVGRLKQQFNGPLENFKQQLADVQDAKNFKIIDADQAKIEFDKIGKAYNDAVVGPMTTSSEIMTTAAEQAARNIQDSFADYLFDPFSSGTEGMLTTFRKILAQMAAELITSQVSKAAKGFDWAGLASSVVGAIGGGIGSAFSSVGTSVAGSITSAAENSIGKLAGNFISQVGSSVYHDGGIVGSGSAPTRQVPASLFAGAPRFHNGLAPDEFPAILQTGERVMSRKEVQADKQGSNMVNHININVQAPQGRVEPRSITQLQASLGRTLQKSAARNS